VGERASERALEEGGNEASVNWEKSKMRSDYDDDVDVGGRGGGG
jgi:hypothetical protein